MTRYTITPESSALTAVARSDLHPVEARAARLTGTIDATLTGDGVDVSRPASARIELSTDALLTDNPLVQRELRRRLDTRRYPTATAAVREVRGSGTRYEVRGDLALRHVTGPLRGHAVLVAGDTGRIEVTGELVLDVREFQLDPPRLLGLRVYPEVTVTVRLLAIAEPEP